MSSRPERAQTGLLEIRTWKPSRAISKVTLSVIQDRCIHINSKSSEHCRVTRCTYPYIYEENCPVLPVLLFPDCIGRLVAATVARRARLFSPPSASEPFPLFFVPIRPDCPIFLTNQFQIFKTYGNLGLAVFQLGVDLTLFDPACFGPFKTRETSSKMG